VPSRRVPDLDDKLRRRLARRFGSAVELWLDALPPVLSDLAERWNVEFDSLIQRGSISVVIRCRTAEGRPVVLKVSPERNRILEEAAALANWRTIHVPGVLAVDVDAGALLVEAIEPGTPLADAAGYPDMESVVSLLNALHADAAPAPDYRPVADHIVYLFDSSRTLYKRKPDLVELIPAELYERSRELALRLARAGSPTVLLHGDLTPVNVLDGGEDRGLVAIDPAPCLGDPAFDAIDLVLFRAPDADTIVKRAEQLAPAIGADAGRLLNWCSAFAAMAALEMAEATDSFGEELAPFLALASRV
jgi:streptomycin 6-kinase